MAVNDFVLLQNIPRSITELHTILRYKYMYNSYAIHHNELHNIIRTTFDKIELTAIYSALWSISYSISAFAAKRVWWQTHFTCSLGNTLATR